jgi:Tfp pilus assembly protein PilF
MKEMSAQEFVRRLKNLLDGTDNRFIFFLGAGCSISSGIPAAGPLTKDWLIRLKKLQTGSEDNFEPWVKDLLPEYSDENASLFYGKTIEKLFLTPDERQKEIERLTENKDPGFGYVILAQLLSQGTYGRCCNTILTTNFDDLVADGLYLYNNKKPLVIVHDSLVSFVKVTRTRPLVIKLHGDARLAPRNTESETTALDEAVKRVLKSLLSESGLIFIGYGGNDQSIIDALEELGELSLPGGVYWVGNGIPTNKMGKWLKKRKAIWVKHRDFDELMVLILDEFGLDHPDKERFDRLLNNYFKTFEELKAKVDDKPESDEKKIIEEAVEKAAKKFKDARSVLIEVNKYVRSDKTKAIQIFHEGINKFPDSALLLNNYALFLAYMLNDFDEAEKYFLRSIELEPNSIPFLLSYSIFIRIFRKDYEKVEKYILKALGIDPNNVFALTCYSTFLRDVLKLYDKSEDYILKALNLEPSNPYILNSYAIFLKEIKKDYDRAGQCYEKALNSKPIIYTILGNYAGLLLARGEYDKGKQLLNKAIENADNNMLLIECQFYLYAHDNENMDSSLSKIKELIYSGVRSPDWNLMDNVKRAIEDGHPHPEFLETLAKVISEEADATELEKYDEWTKSN